jgi:hypothetical protein
MDQTEIRDVNTLFMQCMGHDSPPYHMLFSIPILGAVKKKKREFYSSPLKELFYSASSEEMLPSFVHSTYSKES